VTAVEPVATAADGVDPSVDGNLINLDGYTLDQILQRKDIVITDALRRILERIVEQPRDQVSGFNNWVV